MTVSIEIEVADDTTLATFETAFEEMEEVVEARLLFGRPDYLLRVLMADGVKRIKSTG